MNALTDIQRKVLASIHSEPGTTLPWHAKRTGTTLDQVFRAGASLREAELIRTEGVRRGVQYFATEAGHALVKPEDLGALPAAPPRLGESAKGSAAPSAPRIPARSSSRETASPPPKRTHTRAPAASKKLHDGDPADIRPPKPPAPTPSALHVLPPPPPAAPALLAETSSPATEVLPHVRFLLELELEEQELIRDLHRMEGRIEHIRESRERLAELGSAPP